MRKWIKWGVAAYLAYALVLGVIAFCHAPEVPESERVTPEQFRGEGLCPDRFTLVETPREGLLTRLALLKQAERTLDISYYAMEAGETADVFLGAVLDAADRGVRVRLLVDGVSGGLTRTHPIQTRALAGHPNITVRQYNSPSLLRPWTLNGRLHDKYILADDRLMLLGGRNVGDRYFGTEKRTDGLTLDRDLLVHNTGWQKGTEGSVLGEVRGYMNEIWDGKHVREHYAKDSRRGLRRRAEMQAAYAAFCEKHPALFADPSALTADEVPAAKVTFLHNDTHIRAKSPRVGQALGALLRSGREKIVLQSPYIVPDEAVRSLMAELGQTGADCCVLTNSSASTPNLPAFSSYLRGRDDLLESGVRFFEYQGSSSLHAKTYLVDGRLAAVGTYNLDPRSAHLDTELMLVVDSPELTEKLEQTLNGYFDRSLEALPGGGYAPREGVEALEVSGFKRFLTAAVGILLRPVRFLL